mmetsp:Transcript_57454/g.136605  ORF Transcript_57454/g.136605 Transcript_57454/m.136605 type:complete len:427 (+) Transcript_57454:126-1406(+)
MEDLGHRQIPLEGDSSELRILQLTDLHHLPAETASFVNNKGWTIDVSDTGRYSATRDIEIIATVLARVQPHIVVLTGDIIDGRAFKQRPQNQEVNGWRRTILEVLVPIVAAKCYWTYIPGNHDDDGCPWTREDLLGIYRLDEEAPGCLSAGATSFNHTFTVGPHDEASSSSLSSTLRFWLFDSGGNHPDDRLRYYTFSPGAVEGYKTLAATQQSSSGEIAFFHIPLPQAAGLTPIAGRNCLFEAALLDGKVPKPWCWQPFTSLVRLLGKDRVVASSKLESGLFDAFVQQGTLTACFFGHDHMSDAVLERDGIYMVYGRVGATTPPVDWEGAAGPLPFPVGARVISWHPPSACSPNNDGDMAGVQGHLSTWVEEQEGPEDGSRVLLAPRTSAGKIGIVKASAAAFLWLSGCAFVLGVAFHADTSTTR